MSLHAPAAASPPPTAAIACDHVFSLPRSRAGDHDAALERGQPQAADQQLAADDRRHHPGREDAAGRAARRASRARAPCRRPGRAASRTTRSCPSGARCGRRTSRSTSRRRRRPSPSTSLCGKSTAKSRTTTGAERDAGERQLVGEAHPRGEYAVVFSKVLVANRGEIAIRVFRALRELGIGVGRRVLRCRPRRAARRARGRGLRARRAHRGRELSRRREADRGRRGARARRRCIPGYGFLAENAGSPARSRMRARLDRPAAEAIELMGTKTAARARCRRPACRSFPGTTEPLGSAAEIAALGEELGYPLLVKAAAGGGGKGMKVVASAAEAEAAFESAQREGAGVLRRPGRLRRAVPRGPAARRGAGPRRRARQRHPPRRARLHDPAPPPEARRGVAVAGVVARAARAHRRRSRSTPRAPPATAAPGRSRACSRRTAPTTSWR